MEPTNLLALPFEILVHILSYLHDVASIKAVLCVGPLQEPMLNSCITISGQVHDGAVMDTIPYSMVGRFTHINRLHHVRVTQITTPSPQLYHIPHHRVVYTFANLNTMCKYIMRGGSIAGHLLLTHNTHQDCPYYLWLQDKKPLVCAETNIRVIKVLRLLTDQVFALTNELVHDNDFEGSYVRYVPNYIYFGHNDHRIQQAIKYITNTGRGAHVLYPTYRMRSQLRYILPGTLRRYTDNGVKIPAVSVIVDYLVTTMQIYLHHRNTVQLLVEHNKRNLPDDMAVTWLLRHYIRPVDSVDSIIKRYL